MSSSPKGEKDCQDRNSNMASGSAKRRHRTRLSPEIWAGYKEVIIDLYKTQEMSLQSVMHIMSAQYGFEASRRNYQTQLKKWRISKNLNRSQKDALHRQLSAGNIIFDGDNAPKNLQRKLRRHVYEVRKRYCTQTKSPEQKSVDDMASSSRAGREEFMNESEMTSSNVSVFTSEGEENQPSPGARIFSAHPPTSSSGYSSMAEPWTRPGQYSALTQSREGHSPEDHSSDSFSRDLRELSLASARGASIPARLTANATTLNLAVVLRCVQEFTESHLGATGGENSTFQNIPTAAAAPANTLRSPIQSFWFDVQTCVYLYKLNDIMRAQPLLDQICSTPSEILMDMKIEFMRELLSVFSPVNFRRHPHIRRELLGHVTRMAEQTFGREYAITVLCRELEKDQDSRHTTEMALRCLLSSAFLARSPLTFDTERSIIALLRRDKALAEAEQMAVRCSNLQSTLVRPHEARDAAKELAHVYMDMGELERAKQLCMKRVGKAVALNGQIGHEYHDQRTIEALEDLAKIEEQVLAFAHSVTWLEHAVELAKDLHEPPIVMAHLLDKLDRVLRACGREAEAAQMVRIYAPSSWRPNVHSLFY